MIQVHRPNPDSSRVRELLHCVHDFRDPFDPFRVKLYPKGNEWIITTVAENEIYATTRRALPRLWVGEGGDRPGANSRRSGFAQALTFGKVADDLFFRAWHAVNIVKAPPIWQHRWVGIYPVTLALHPLKVLHRDPLPHARRLSEPNAEVNPTSSPNSQSGRTRQPAVMQLDQELTEISTRPRRSFDVAGPRFGRIRTTHTARLATGMQKLY